MSVKRPTHPQCARCKRRVSRSSRMHCKACDSDIRRESRTLCIVCECGNAKAPSAKLCKECRVIARRSHFGKRQCCYHCNITKATGEFTKDRSRPSGLASMCKACNRKQRNTPRRRLAQFKYYLRTSYGMTVEQYNTLWAAQNMRCLPCGTPLIHGGRQTHIDHDHKTGRVRGLLCQFCNLALGYIRDDVEVLTGLRLYLQSATTAIDCYAPKQVKL